MATQFSDYKPLKSREIRLLKCQKASALSFTFHTVSVDKAPPYSALSYTWGEGRRNDQYIFVDGQTFPIRTNLFIALEQFQRGIESKRQSQLLDSYFWIDAISINQRDDGERSSQVRFMTDIYMKAHRVIIWLGIPPDMRLARAAVNMMKECQKMARDSAQKDNHYRPWWAKATPMSPAETDRRFVERAIPKAARFYSDDPASVAYQAWSGVNQMLQREWWSRTWVYQESTRPERVTATQIYGVHTFDMPSTVNFVYGPLTFDWKSLLTTVFLTRTALEMQQQVALQQRLDLQALGRLETLRTSRLFELRRGFLDLLQLFRDSQCGDARDKVYAPLCLGPAEARQAIAVDYATKTPQQLYIDVAAYQLSQRGHELSILGHTMKHPSTSSRIPSMSLPSWVPNWDNPPDLSPLPKALRVQELPRPQVGRPSRKGTPHYAVPITIAWLNVYLTFRNLPPPSISVSRQVGTLSITGCILDTITHTCPIPSDPTNPYANDTFRTWQSWTTPPGKYPTGQDFTEIFARTLCADVFYSPEDEVIRRGASVNELRDASTVQAGNGTYNSFRIASHGVYKAYLRATRGRILARLKQAYIGLVPASAMPGDLVCAFFGGVVLYVVRPLVLNGQTVASQFEYIGESYVHGAMDGEVAEMLKRGFTSVRTFVLV